MKTGLFLSALVQLAAAQPHNNRHAHLHEKRGEVVVTQVQTVTAAAPDAVVYVNQEGQPISTSYIAHATAQAAPVVQTSVVPAPAAKHDHHHDHHRHHNKKPAAAAAADADTAPVAKHHHHHKAAGGTTTTAANTNLEHTLGLAYSPYNADNGCKTQEEINNDFDTITGYGMVRLYGVDCDQVALVAPAAKAKGMKLFLGMYDIEDIAGQAQTMASGLNNDWSNVQAVSIGNEWVNSNTYPASEVVSAVQSTKSIMQGLGYHGPVVTVDTFVAIINNPSLCEVSDFAAANAHAFFDPDVSAPGAGAWARQTATDVANACPGKKVVITESGWPHQGIANGAAVPGYSEQAAAISSLKSSFSEGGIILFSAFDNLWQKVEAYSFDSEPYWGIFSGQ